MKAQVFASVVIATMVFVISPALADWSTPVPITELNSAASESGAYLSADGLTMYFDRGSIPGGTSWFQLYTATRSSLSSPFTNIAPISELSATAHVGHPCVSQDGLRLYYEKNWQIQISTRTSTSTPWSAGQYLNVLNSVGNVETPRLSADELTVVFDSPNGTGGHGGYDIFIASRLNTSVPFGNIRNLSELNSSANDFGASLSADGLSIYFTSVFSGQTLCYKATRDTVNDQFGGCEVLPFAAGFSNPTISADGKTMLLGANWDTYVSTIPEPATMVLLGLGGMIIRKFKGKR